MIMEDCQGEKGCLEGGKRNILEEKSDKENYFKKTNRNNRTTKKFHYSFVMLTET